MMEDDVKWFKIIVVASDENNDDNHHECGINSDESDNDDVNDNHETSMR